MKPSLIIYGVPNGKTRFAERIAKFYGLRNGGLFNIGMISSRGYVYFVDGPFNLRMSGIKVKSFSEVADEINAAIPLTDWRYGVNELPDRNKKGVYLATVDRGEEFYRYWDGAAFMYGAYDVNSASSMGKHAWWKSDLLFWRGLSQEPINTEE
jgi:hypothetical protein